MVETGPPPSNGGRGFELWSRRVHPAGPRLPTSNPHPLSSGSHTVEIPVADVHRALKYVASRAAAAESTRRGAALQPPTSVLSAAEGSNLQPPGGPAWK